MSRPSHESPGATACVRKRACSVLALLALLSTPLVSQGHVASRTLEVARELLLQYEGAWSDLPPLQDSLVALGPAAVPTLFGALAYDSLAGEDPGSPAEPLSRQHRMAIAGALERLPHAAVVSHLRSLLPGERAERVEMARLLGRIGSPAELDMLLGLARSSTLDIDRELRPHVEDALGRFLDREPKGTAKLARRLPALDGPTGTSVVRVLGAQATHESLVALARALPKTRALAAPILLEILHLAESLPTPPASKVAESVRGLAHAGDPTVRALASRTLAALDDRVAVPLLIPLLDAAESSVRGAAHAALEELSGHKLVPDRDAWRSWFQSQSQWMETQADNHLRILLFEQFEVASAALRNLAAHRIFSDPLVEELVPLLKHADPHLAARICGVLGHLGSWKAVWPLVRKLNESDAGLCAAAHTALRRITGFELPLDSEAWTAHLRYLKYE